MFDEYTIKDVIEEIIDYRGKTPKKLGGDWSEVKTEYMALSAKNIKKGRIVQPDTIRYVDQKVYNKWMKQEVERGTILITSEAPFGELLYWDSDDKIVLSQRLFGLKIKKEFNSRYIYYYMFSEQFQGELSGRATGSTVTGLRQPELLKCHLRIPNRKYQDIIASILMNIDKKLNLNNQINDNLLEIIKNYYRGKFYNKNGRMTILSSLIKQTIGGDWGKENQEGNYNKKVYCIRGADIPQMVYGSKGKAPIRYILQKNYDKKKLSSNEIIIEISGGSPSQSTGRVAFISENVLKIYENSLICTNFCRAIELIDEKYAPLLYVHLLSLYDEKIFFNYENGTTGIKNLSLTDLINKEHIFIPNDDELLIFNNLFYSLFNKIVENSNENQNLEQLRDTLLPKLMNGEINLENVEI